jgi:GPH family glycoside/pentoside/hexuronide:cation symporter
VTVRTDQARVPVGVKLGYSAGLFGISMVQTSVSVLLLYFYTDFLHIPPALAGGIISAGTFVDAASNIGTAWIATHHRSRLGKYRPFLIYIALPLTLSFAAMFLRPPLSMSALYGYVILTHAIYRICYAFTLMPHASLIGRLSSDANERAGIGSWKAIANNLGLMSAAYFGISTIERLGGADPLRGFAIFGIVFGAIAGISVFISGWTTRERVEDGPGDVDTAAVGAALRLCVRNDQLLVVLASTLLFFIAYVLMNSGVVYFFKYIVGNAGTAKYAVLAIGVGGIVFPPLWSQLIYRTSKAFAWALGCGLICAAFLVMYGFGFVATVALLCVYLTAGAGKSAVILNYYAIVADAIDYGHWRQGAKAEAYGFGLLSLTNKVGSALGSGLLGVLLQWSGLVVGATQSANVVARLWMVTCLAPAAIMALSGATVLLFRITATRHAEIRAALSARANGESPA